MNIKFLFPCLLLFLGTSSLSAQNADAKITISQVVDAGADEVWTILRQLDNIDELSSLVGSVEFIGEFDTGGKRICVAPEEGQGRFVESILDFDDAGRTYTYAVVEGIPAKGVVSNFKVVDLGYQKSMIVWTSTYEQFLENPQMTEEQFTGFLNMAATEMVGNVASKASTAK